ncbi:MAG: hypothetical protein LBG21_02930 [Campylobacteraceae bacterium]|jgi:hypothetical protein|nr:hypothetical protein [Campylobacteraceae bacterium]
MDLETFGEIEIDGTKYILKKISFEWGRRILALILSGGNGEKAISSILRDPDLPFLEKVINERVYFEKDGEIGKVSKEYLENNQSIYIELLAKVSEAYSNPFLPKGSGA